MTASFERFDYQLRSNKHIERKIIFDLLSRARKFFDLRNYKYLGLGSMWFADHRLAHRQLDISSLWSIETTEHSTRAEFNKPYGSVKVFSGMSHEVLPTFGAEEWSSPLIAWMDYDGALNEDVEMDLSRFVLNLAPESILLLTVNADFRTYKTKQNALEAAARRGEQMDGRAVGKLVRFLGNVIPSKYQQVQENSRLLDATEEDFPAVMAESILAYLSHKVVSSGRLGEGGPLRFVPIFNIFHQDGAEMITVGGAISSVDGVGKWESLLADDPVLSVAGTSPVHHRLNLIPLTLREKLTLDRLLPSNVAIGELARENGLQIGDEQVEKYRLHYRHFPMFFESPV